MMDWEDSLIQSPDDMQRLVNQMGILPFFAGEIGGFSIEEHTTPACWFPDDTVEGVWEWKGPTIVEGDCAYGKFYLGKACFVSMDWFPDFVNYRRSRHVLSDDERLLLATLQERHSLLSKELKRLCGYVAPRQPRHATPLLREAARKTKSPRTRRATRRESFDTAITRLQMSGHVVTADFEYLYDKQGRRYGWGVARYCTPEDFFGEERMAVNCSPDESGQRLAAHLRQLLPCATDEQIAHVVG